jgi:hypothetical protein
MTGVWRLACRLLLLSFHLVYIRIAAAMHMRSAREGEPASGSFGTGGGTGGGGEDTGARQGVCGTTSGTTNGPSNGTLISDADPAFRLRVFFHFVGASPGAEAVLERARARVCV